MRSQIKNKKLLEQLKLQKIEEEVEKVRIEKERVSYEFQKLKAKEARPWYRKENFIRIITQIFVGIAILGFYIRFILTPIFQKDSIENQLSITKQKKELYEKQLMLDSLKISIAKYFGDINGKNQELLVEKLIRKKKIDSLENLRILELSIVKEENKLLRKENQKLSKNRLTTNNKFFNDQISKLQDSLKSVTSQKNELTKRIKNDSIIIKNEFLLITENDIENLEIEFKNLFKDYSSNLNKLFSLKKSDPNYNITLDKLVNLFMDQAKIQLTVPTDRTIKIYSSRNYFKNLIKYASKFSSPNIEINTPSLSISAIESINSNPFSIGSIFDFSLESDFSRKSFSMSTLAYITLNVRIEINTEGTKQFNVKIESIEEKISSGHF